MLSHKALKIVYLVNRVIWLIRNVLSSKRKMKLSSDMAM